MSISALTNLRDYLIGTLSKEDMAWLSLELAGHVREEEELKPYTKEELNAIIDESERQIANGEVYDFNEVLRELEEELDNEFVKEEQLLEAV